MSSSLAGRSTRNEILHLLRRKRAASAEDISSELGITPNAVRQHLGNLERQGMVLSTPVRHKRGRPSLQFALTDRADSAFPKRYGQLATMVLTELDEMGGPDLIDELFRRVAARRAQHIEGTLDGLSFDEKLDRIVAWIAKAGTLTEAQQNPDGTITVKIHNCPFRNTALKFPQVCTITPHLLAGLLQAPVSQEKSIHRRDPFCSFIVQRPRPAVAD
ncbi:MAG: ArsR family transcriptional regulator [Chloroflexi bacterium]|nr:MAG: ArsR family transcriptional regulator [Chloroflexota bacterium]TME14931.1 MAG: ArsR family transcriptional regulator [Chloroflexota bacterium]TME17881.1 MAG: ArsR family transcriptional regulator [Chloroflexota bacterium]